MRGIVPGAVVKYTVAALRPASMEGVNPLRRGEVQHEREGDSVLVKWENGACEFIDPAKLLRIKAP